MHPKQTEYDKARRERLRAEGLTQVRVWIPENQRQHLIDYAADLVEQHRNDAATQNKESDDD